MNIDTDYKIDDLTLIKHLKSIDSPFLPKIQEVYEQVKDALNSRVQHVFPHYTLHNTGHSFRIMEYMVSIRLSTDMGFAGRLLAFQLFFVDFLIVLLFRIHPL